MAVMAAAAAAAGAGAHVCASCPEVNSMRTGAPATTRNSNGAKGMVTPRRTMVPTRPYSTPVGDGLRTRASDRQCEWTQGAGGGGGRPLAAPVEQEVGEVAEPALRQHRRVAEQEGTLAHRQRRVGLARVLEPVVTCRGAVSEPGRATLQLQRASRLCRTGIVEGELGLHGQQVACVRHHRERL
jgi:hypothetical protein